MLDMFFTNMSIKYPTRGRRRCTGVFNGVGVGGDGDGGGLAAHNGTWCCRARTGRRGKRVVTVKAVGIVGGRLERMRCYCRVRVKVKVELAFLCVREHQPSKRVPVGGLIEPILAGFFICFCKIH